VTSARADLPAELGAAVASWTAQDPDPQTRAELERLVRARTQGDTAAAAELRDAFSGRLEFGTAGLRGRLGPGPHRMNRVTVGQAAAGLAGYLVAEGAGGGAVLVGYDARHGSERFARDSAEILTGAGFAVRLASAPLPTPVVAFGIRHLGCVAGVVVTASHNPPQDNGYKVYLGDGAQIVPPADRDISRRIEQVSRRSLADIPRAESYEMLGPELVEDYLDRVAALVAPDAPRTLRWVYTPLHGVGGAVVAGAVARAGFPPAEPVAAQAEPDPDFSTVAFPNPEEPGALDLALARAAAVGADLVVANDPDADRCAVAVPDAGTWRMLRGDELGVLLADDALRRGVRGTYACSIVSSTLLARLAAAYGQPFQATLTGFKWIARAPGLAFGYEEALGYCVDPGSVRDKDGIAALIRVLALAAELRAAGQSLLDRLDEIERRFGVHATDQLSVRVSDLGLITAAMARLRAKPPAELAGEPVEVHDLAAGWAGLPPTDGVLLVGGAVRVVARPSGTEPKLKAYLEARQAPAESQALGAARRRARATLGRLRADLAAVLDLPA